MNKISNQIRQGDVLLHPSNIPDGAVEVHNTGTIVLAEGEATGHSHTLPRTGVREFVTKDGRRFVSVRRAVSVRHQEHGTLVLQPGTYEIRRQVEQWMDEVRQVVD